MQIAVYTVGLPVLKRCRDLFENAIMGENVVRMHQSYDIASSPCDAAVDRVVDPPVGVADEVRAMVDQFFNDFECTIGGTAILDHVLKLDAYLSLRAGDAVSDGIATVPNGGNDRYFHGMV